MSRKPHRAIANPKIVVCYCRVSTEEQSLGPEAQQAAMRRWCDASGAAVAALHADLGVSGAASLEKRPGLLAAIQSLGTHGAGVLLVAKRDRLARDPIISAMIEAAAERLGARVVSAAGEGSEGDDPSSVLMRRLVDAFSEYERGVIRARTRAALGVKRARSERVGSVPYGYSLAEDRRTLIPNADEQIVIARMVELTETGASLNAVARALQAEGYRSRSERWHATTVLRVLARRRAKSSSA